MQILKDIAFLIGQLARIGAKLVLTAAFVGGCAALPVLGALLLGA